MLCGMECIHDSRNHVGSYMPITQQGLSSKGKVVNFHGFITQVVFRHDHLNLSGPSLYLVKGDSSPIVYEKSSMTPPFFVQEL